MMIEIPRSTHGAADVLGNWKPVILDDKLTAKMTCPGCGCFAYLSEHSIGTDGVVSPSVRCATDQGGCGQFHDTVKLIGWGPFIGLHP